MPLNLRPFLTKASNEDALDYNLAVLRDSAAYKVAQNLYRIVDPDDRRLASFPSFLIKLDKLLSQYALSQKARIEQEDGDDSQDDYDQDDDSNNEDYDDQDDDSQDESDDSNDDDSNEDSQDDNNDSDDDSDSSDDEDSDLGDDQDDTDNE